MKEQRRCFRAAVSGIASVIIASSILVLALARPAFAKKTGNIEIGFIGVPPQGFEHVLLNVQAVRINPKANVATNDSRFVDILVPPNIGSGTIAKPGDLQFDLNQVQTVPQFFNTQAVKVNTYMTLQLQIDPTNPGTIIPACPSAGALEGCINYPMQLESAGQVMNVPISNGGIPVRKNQLSQLVVTLTVNKVTPPTTSGGAFIVTITASLSQASSFLGTVSGTLVGATGNVMKRKVRNLAVTAEALGTNTIIATAPVNNGNFTIGLPASSDIGNLYDVYVSGGKTTYAAERLAPVFAGSSTPLTFTVKENEKVGSISGSISDQCTGQPIQGATLQILIPPANNSSVDCMTDPDLCVSVATANTDNDGNFPIPGTAAVPAPFNNVPLSTTFAIEVSAPGYDTLMTTATASGTTNKGGTCAASSDPKACTLSLATTTLSGTLNLAAAPPAGTNVMFQVFAEDAGTNKIENVSAPVTVRSSSSSGNFTMNLPTNKNLSATTFDLFATAVDLFQGATDPFPGHTIVVSSAPVSAVDACTSPTAVTLGPMDCVGHGSVAQGAVANPDTGTTVELLKDGIALMQAPVIPIPPIPPVSGNSYSICAPPDSYTLQRLEAVVPAAGVTPSASATPSPVGTPQPISLATPQASPTASPSVCPTTCSTAPGVCPGVCVNTVPEPL